MNRCLGRFRVACRRSPPASFGPTLMTIGFLFVGVAAVADEQGITVTGTGEVLASPDCLEIDIGASGSAELTADAIIKYRDRLRRVTEAFKKLDIEHLQVKRGELSIGNVADEQHPHPRVTIARALRIVVTGIREMPDEELLTVIGKVIDAAKDTGAAGEEAQSRMFTVRFALQDPKSVREKACRKALEDAKEQASRLANLAGGRLGRAVSVTDMPAAVDYPTVTEVIQAIYGGDENLQPEEQGRIVSGGLKDIPVRVSLRVRFELLEDREGAVQAAFDK